MGKFECKNFFFLKLYESNHSQNFNLASQESLQNNNANGVPFALPNNDPDIKEYSHNFNNQNPNSNNDFAANNNELENFSNNANQQPKTFSHLKSNSNEIRMDIYEDERYF